VQAEDMLTVHKNLEARYNVRKLCPHVFGIKLSASRVEDAALRDMKTAKGNVNCTITDFEHEIYVYTLLSCVC
jgi:hypothetical protein